MTVKKKQKATLSFVHRFTAASQFAFIVDAPRLPALRDGVDTDHVTVAVPTVRARQTCPHLKVAGEGMTAVVYYGWPNLDRYSKEAIKASTIRAR